MTATLGAYELDRVYQGDCLELMRALPDGCIDLTVTSPPYDDMDDDFNPIQKNGLRLYNGYSWDFKGVANELYRVTKQGGVVVWVVNDPTINGSESLASSLQKIYFRRVGFNIHDTMIYEKDSLNMPQSNRYYQVSEYMFVFSKGSLKTVNLLQEKTIHRGNNHSSTTRLVDGALKNHKFETGKATRNKGNVWRFGVGYMKTTLDQYTYIHPAMFPEKLANDHILSWSNPNDIVLDVFAGSGTTLKMAKQLGRRFLGFELSAAYCELARKRIAAANVPLFV